MDGPILSGMRRSVMIMVMLLATACSGTDAPADADPTSSETSERLPTIEAAEGWPPLAFNQFELAVQSPDHRRTARFRVYDPATGTSRDHGLTGVSDLPLDAGMLFRFEQPRRNGFWMKNTVIPLSIAFADSDGVIATILDMEPCGTDPCPGYDPDAPYVYALEVNRGEFGAQGVEEGWRLDVPSDLPPAPK
jgi:uncharacterized protein